jgi:uncharacterized Rossmann fold enzyme
MNFWDITPDWKGQAAAILGSGPSMGIDVAAKIRKSGMRSIAVNNQGISMVIKGMIQPAMAPWADILYAADRDWWYHNQAAAACFKGKKVSISQHGQDFPILDDTVMIRHGGLNGFDDRRTHIRTGGNSGYQAVHIAAHLGANPILLFGFDMHGKHWFGHHPWRGNHIPRYSVFIKSFETLEPECRKRGIEVINCTPKSDLQCFPIMGVDEGIEHALRKVRESKEKDTEQVGEKQIGDARKKIGGAQVA